MRDWSTSCGRRRTNRPGSIDDAIKSAYLPYGPQEDDLALAVVKKQ